MQRKRRVLFSQEGKGLRHFSSPILLQQGRGLGGVLSGIFRSVIPFFKKPIIRQGLARIGKSAAMAGLEALNKSMDDQNENRPTFKQALRTSARTETRRLAGDTLRDIKAQTPPVAVPIKASSVRIPRRRLVPYKTQRGRGRFTRKRVAKDIFSQRY